MGGPATGSTELSGATGSAQSVRLRVSALSVDGHEIDNFLADTLPDRPDAALLGTPLLDCSLAVLIHGGFALTLGASRSRGGSFPKDRDDRQHQQRRHGVVKVPAAPLGAQIPAQHGSE
jgi:hypothetical protein